MTDNREFADQIRAAMVSLGTEEALGCMARVMCYVAENHGQTIEFESALSVVTITPQQPNLLRCKIEQVNAEHFRQILAD